MSRPWGFLSRRWGPGRSCRRLGYLLACVLVETLAGCGALEVPPSRLLLVWVDVSRSVRDPAAVRAVYARAVESARPGDRLLVAPIGAATMTAYQAALDTVVPGTRLPRVLADLSTGQSRAAGEAATRELVARALAVRDSLMAQRAAGSHIVDALEQSSRLIAPHRAAGGGPVEVLLLTDGEETAMPGRLQRGPPRPGAPVPPGTLDLGGAIVWMVGVTGPNTAEYESRRRAWEHTLRAAGGTVVPGRVGHMLLEVPFRSPPPAPGVPGRSP